MTATHRWRGGELLARIEANVVKALDRSALIVQREIKLQLSKSKSPSAPGTPPGVVSGLLRKSVQIDRSQINAFKIRVGPGVIYARIHELGGTIRPKARAPIKMGRHTKYGFVGNMPSMINQGPMTGPWLTFKTKDGRWHKVRSVTLPPRPYVRPGLRAARPRVLAQFSAERLLRGTGVPMALR